MRSDDLTLKIREGFTESFPLRRTVRVAADHLYESGEGIAALQSVADMLSSIRACVLECGGAPPL